ncbi:SpoIIE family protein phosphatase [Frankia sp. Cas3]|uniref:SpoIIE family protein phosphatase n=1 Tax=Frankia sp. Cas3 TaxID=3073926 RepID=UPI002AD2909F|nr:SpoIIE family protein phosphatase [Frankia sp. Cas3]
MATRQAASPADDDQIAQLVALIAYQQRELQALRARSAADAMVEVAQGVLIERLRCSPAQAAHQLARLATQSGMPLVELAADVINRPADDSIAPVVPDPHDQLRAQLAQIAVRRATDGSQVAAAVLEEALAPVGAVAVALWMIEPDGALDLVGEAGLGALEASRWQRIPPQMDSLAQRVVQDGQPGWWPGGCSTHRRMPLVGSWLGARAVLPLMNAGALLGVMEICWPAPLDEFAPALRHQFLALAEVCAQSLGTAQGRTHPSRVAWLPALLDGLLTSTLLAHTVRDDDGRIIDFYINHVSDGFVDPAGRDPHDLLGCQLLHVYPLLAVSGGLFNRAVNVLTTGRPYHAAGVVVRVLAGDATVAVDMDVRIARLYDGIVITWRPTDGTDGLAALLQHAQRLGQLGGWQQDLRTGDVRWTDHTFALFRLAPTATPIALQDLDSHVLPEDIGAVDRFRKTLLTMRRPASVAFRLVRVDGVTRHIRAFGEPVTDSAGALIAVSGAYQDLSTQYHTQVALAATREQLADTEQRAEDRHRLALQLQHAITPSSADPIQAASLDVAVRYRPAEQDHLVGGDWYDVVVLPSQDVFLVIGDIAGHGITAVTGMVTLRNSLRGLAMTGAGPAQLLTWLNSVAYHLTDNITGTVICGLYKPTTHMLRWAQAGHLPPVLVRRGAARTLCPPQGTLLGADVRSCYEEATVSLQVDDGLLLFTDGLVERRATALSDTLEALLSLAGQPIGDLQHYADNILQGTTPDTDDDACLIAVRLR